MTDQEQINQLNAQVNCLRELIRKATVTDMDITEFLAVLEATPEQCLAEVKANAIYEAAENTNDDFDCVTPFDLRFYANQLREQAK